MFEAQFDGHFRLQYYSCLGKKSLVDKVLIGQWWRLEGKKADQHSSEVAFALHIQPSWVRIPSVLSTWTMSIKPLKSFSWKPVVLIVRCLRSDQKLFAWWLSEEFSKQRSSVLQNSLRKKQRCLDIGVAILYLLIYLERYGPIFYHSWGSPKVQPVARWRVKCPLQ